MKLTFQNQLRKGIQIVLTLFFILCYSLTNAQKPKGKLFIIGGGNRSDQLMQHVIDLAQFKKNRLYRGTSYVE